MQENGGENAGKIRGKKCGNHDVKSTCISIKIYHT